MLKSDNVKRVLIFHKEGCKYDTDKVNRLLSESESIMGNCIDRVGNNDKKNMQYIDEVFDIIKSLPFRRCIRSGHTEVNLEYWRELSNLKDLSKMRDVFLRDVKVTTELLKNNKIQVQDPTI